MLQAIMQGKAGRVAIDGKATESWRTVFKKREDLLTAAFWSRIGYLSTERRGVFLREFVGLSEGELGEYHRMHFWPSYALKMRNVEQQRVEPDVVLEFEKADIVIEVKPPEGGKQYHDQWQREIIAYHQDERRKPHLIFIALGNIPKSLGKFNYGLIGAYKDNTQVLAREWHHAKNALLSLRDVDAHEAAIIQDCLSALSLFGIRTALPNYNKMTQLTATLALQTEITSIFASFSVSK